MPDQHTKRYDGINIALGAIALIALIYVVSPLLSPFLLLLVIALLVFPFRSYRSAKSILVTTGIIFALWFFVEVAHILFPFIMGFVLAYLFNPIVSMLERRRIKRVWSSLIVAGTFVALVGTAIWFLAPMVISQFQALLSNLKGFVESSTITLDERGLHTLFVSMGIPEKYVDEYLTHQILPKMKELFHQAPSMLYEVLGWVPGILSQLLNLIIIPIAFFYFLLDWESLTSFITRLIPVTDRPRWLQVFRNIDRIFYAYIKGQSTIAIIIGTLAGIAFTVLGVPYAGLLAVCIAFLDLIPFIGLIMSILIVETVILVSLPITVWNVLMGPMLIIILHVIEVYGIAPRLVGKSVGIPPLVLILSILLFGYFLGFIGMLIAVPTAGIILQFVREYQRSLISKSEE
jgi:predicted PurR-regulated permease PerM